MWTIAASFRSSPGAPPPTERATASPMRAGTRTWSIEPTRGFSYCRTPLEPGCSLLGGSRKSRACTSLLAAATALLTLTSAAQSHAYRPFDGTDADVAELGTFELE